MLFVYSDNSISKYSQQSVELAILDNISISQVLIWVCQNKGLSVYCELHVVFIGTNS